MKDPLELISAYLDDSISDAETAELEEWLMADAAHAEIFARRLQLHSQIRDVLTGEVFLQAEHLRSPELFAPIGELCDEEPAHSMDDTMMLPAITDEDADAASTGIIEVIDLPAPVAGQSPDQAKRHGIPKLIRGTAAAIILVGVAVAAILIHRPRSGAVLARTINATFIAPYDTIQAGSAMPTSEMELSSGFAFIQYSTGAQIIVEAPARLNASAANGITLLSGKLTAVVPPSAHGFKVICPDATVVDLGTEFGVNVRTDGQTDIDVFKGTIALAPASTNSPASNAAPEQPLLVTAGSARRILADRSIAPIAFNPTPYVRRDDFDHLSQVSSVEPLARWQAYSQALRTNPDLVAYYTFDRNADTPDRLVNLSSAGSSLDGELAGGEGNAGPTWSTGRWPEKGALAFDSHSTQHVSVPPSDALDFSRDGRDSQPFTLCAWIKPISSDADVVTGGIVSRGGAFHEQYALDFGPAGGPLRTWVRAQDDPANNGTQIVAVVANLSSWHLVATVYDPDAGNLQLFIDGKFISQRQAIKRLLSDSGPIYIGSRTGKTGRFDSVFTGSIDELAIFRKPLSAAEILEMYNAGKPQ